MRRTELVCIRDLSKGASRSTIIERGQYIAENQSNDNGIE